MVRWVAGRNKSWGSWVGTDEHQGEGRVDGMPIYEAQLKLSSVQK